MLYKILSLHSQDMIMHCSTFGNTSARVGGWEACVHRICGGLLQQVHFKKRRMDRLRQTQRVGGVKNGTSTAVCVCAGVGGCRFV